MKQSNRILAYSALALVVMLAAFGAIAFDTSNVAYAQGTVPDAAHPDSDGLGREHNRPHVERRRRPLPATNSGPGTASTNGNNSMARLIPDWHQPQSAVLPAAPPTTTRSAPSTRRCRMSGWSDRVNEVAGDMVPARARPDRHRRLPADHRLVAPSDRRHPLRALGLGRRLGTA